jgi:hypothetical protein
LCFVTDHRAQRQTKGGKGSSRRVKQGGCSVANPVFQPFAGASASQQNGNRGNSTLEYGTHRVGAIEPIDPMKVRMKMQISSGTPADRSGPAPHFTGSLRDRDRKF